MASRIKANTQNLLPGITDDVTIMEITTKLSWRDFYVLALVSRDWCQTIRSRRVYNARVLHRSTETLVLLNVSREDDDGPLHNVIALYSMRDNFCCKLPPIPNVDEGFPPSCEAVALDGKIYVMGGLISYPCVSGEVYVLDLVGQRQWKRCANLTRPRFDFGGGVMDGKIYIFGGCGPSTYDCDDGETPIRGSEVYDPEQNTWCKISPMTRRVHADQADIAAEELLVTALLKCGGYYFRDYFQDKNNPKFAKFLEVYDPAKDKWRKLPCSWTVTSATLFMAQGKLYEMRLRGDYGIQVHDTHANSWTRVHKSTFVSNGFVDGVESTKIDPMAVLAVKDELLAVGWWDDFDMDTNGWCLARGKGLGSNTEEISFQNALELTLSLKDLQGWKNEAEFRMQSFEV
ncbi:unnamed protein product [Calypogeia fissa]